MPTIQLYTPYIEKETMRYMRILWNSNQRHERWGDCGLELILWVVTYSILQNFNGLAQVPFEGGLVDAYKGTRRKHSMKFRQIGHTTSQYGQSFFLKTISA